LLMKMLTTFMFLISSTVFAGTVTLKGVSEISEGPDYVALSIKVQTKCYSTAIQSNQDIVKLSMGLQNIIKQHLSFEKGDEMFVRAGLTTRRRETTVTYDELTRRSHTKVLCEKGWTSSRTIDLKFGNMYLWNTLNPALLEHIDALEKNSTPDQKAFVKATIFEPRPRLNRDTEMMMKEQALGEALSDASNKFQIIKRLCKLENAKITALSENSRVILTRGGKRVDYSTTEVLIFDDLKVHLSWSVTWEFENSSGKCDNFIADLIQKIKSR
jgi:hypothetical protein